MFNDIVPQLYQSKIYLAYLSVFQSYQKVFKKFLRRNDGILEIPNNFTIQLKSFKISACYRFTCKQKYWKMSKKIFNHSSSN